MSGSAQQTQNKEDSDVVVDSSDDEESSSTASSDSLSLEQEVEKLEEEEEALEGEEAVRVSKGQYRRNMPRRASKDRFTHSCLRGGIVKAKDRSHSVSKSLRQSDIAKIYLKKPKLSKFRPACLETIFEDPKDGKNFSSRKFKRSTNLSLEGTAIQQKKKQRKAKIRKEFGRRKPIKKIPLEKFMEIMNKNDGDDTNEESRDEQDASTTSMDMEVEVEENISKMNTLLAI